MVSSSWFVWLKRGLSSKWVVKTLDLLNSIYFYIVVNLDIITSRQIQFSLHFKHCCLRKKNKAGELQFLFYFILFSEHVLIFSLMGFQHCEVTSLQQKQWCWCWWPFHIPLYGFTLAGCGRPAIPKIHIVSCGDFI